jgi:hypothetical protein
MRRACSTMEDYERRRLVCNARRRIQMTTLPETRRGVTPPGYGSVCIEEWPTLERAVDTILHQQPCPSCQANLEPSSATRSNQTTWAKAYILDSSKSCTYIYDRKGKEQYHNTYLRLQQRSPSQLSYTSTTTASPSRSTQTSTISFHADLSTTVCHCLFDSPENVTQPARA